MAAPVAGFNADEIQALQARLTELTTEALKRDDATTPTAFTKSLYELLLGSIHACTTAALKSSKAFTSDHTSGLVGRIDASQQRQSAFEKRLAAVERKLKDRE